MSIIHVCKITVSIVTACAEIAFITKAAADYPVAQGNTILNGMISQSRIHRPLENDDLAKDKENNLLKSFKTSQRQFMPLGFYAMVEDMKRVSVLTKLKRNHLNLVHKYRSSQSVIDALDDLEKAKIAGIGILQNLPKKHLKKREGFWQHHIGSLVDHPQIFAWYLPEEVEPKDLAHLRHIAGVIDQKDMKNRPVITYVENYRQGYWEKAAMYTDALVLGAYPIFQPSHPRATGRRIIDKAYEVGVPVVIKAVEAYSSEGRWTRPKELRFDTYLALISGAKGILWYSYAHARENPELMAAIYRLADELNGGSRLGEVILCGDTVEKIQCYLRKGDPYAPAATAFENRTQKKKQRYTTIQWTAKRYDNSIYIFAVNMNEKLGAVDHGGRDWGVSIRFKSPLFRAPEIEVMHENRWLEVSHHSFDDTIRPIGTRVYRVPLPKEFR